MRSKIFVLLLLVLTAFCPAAWSETYAEGEALAVFRAPEGLSVSAANVNVAEAVGEIEASVAESYETLSEIEGKIFVLVRSSTKSTEQLISELKARPDVITASPNYYTHRQSFSAARVPNDPSADLCWGLKAIRAPEVWEETTGSRDIYVCVIDGGLYRHPDLVDNIAAEYGYNTQTVSRDDDPTFGSWDADLLGHGTHVAGIVGAVGNNGIGVAGVNWNVKIIPVRIFDNFSMPATISYEIQALNYIAYLLQKNPSMKLAAVNLSLGSAFPITPSEMENNVYYMAYRALDSLNRTLLVFAAGNSGVENGVPTLFDDMSDSPQFKKGYYFYPPSFTGLSNSIVVGATASDDTAAVFTNWGTSVDIAAPGVDILSTYSPIAIQERLPGMYNILGGTSMAAPHVTGAAALLMSAFPDATPGQIKAALLDGANRDKNPLVYPYAGYVKMYVDIGIKALDLLIETGRIPLASRDEFIEKITLEYEEKYAPYKQLDGTGRVSRTGLLDVKAAYDLLAARGTGNTSGVGSSSGGCGAGYPAAVLGVIMVAVVLAKMRKV